MIHPIALNIPYGGLISSVSVQCAAGTGTFTIYIDSVAVVGLINLSVTTTEAQHYATGTNAFLAGQDIKADVTDLGGLTDFSVSINLVRSIPSQCASTLVTLPNGTVIDGSKEENIAIALVLGTALVNVPFAYQKKDSSGVPTSSYWVTMMGPAENIVDNATLWIEGRVVDKTTTGLTMELNASPDTNNYIQRMNVKVI